MIEPLERMLRLQLVVMPRLLNFELQGDELHWEGEPKII